MKKYLSLVIANFIILCNIQAQHVNVGIKGGLNAYTITGNNNANYTTKIGFNLGLIGHIHKSRNWAFQPELVYSAQGAKYKISGVNVDLQLNYINIPILIQYMFNNGFRLELGPQLGILASARAKTNNVSNNLSSEFKSTDIGLAVGMSYVKPSTGFGFDIRYNLGLTNISTSNSFNTYNSGFQLGLFYLFQHKS